ncbi:MAG: helix-turn-helix domain-containing protein [Clostridia bacterium]|nr:helix-turn-helix domain-containing protein [Clostridia bacterium]
MNIREQNISISHENEILFSHLVDNLLPTHRTLHLHDCIEIYVYLEGDVDFVVEDNCFSLKKGDVIITDSNVLHKPIIQSDKRYERIYFRISTAALNAVCRGTNPFAFLQQSKQLISFTPEEFAPIHALLLRISELLKDDKPPLYLAYAYFLEFLYHLNTAQHYHLNDASEKKAVSPIIEEILRYIDTAPISVTSVKELAANFHIHPSYLSTLFSTYLRVSPKQYLTTKQVAAAKILLAGDHSLSDIAYECGFSSCSHFIDVFRRTTDITPNEYRRRIKR